MAGPRGYLLLALALLLAPALAAAPAAIAAGAPGSAPAPTGGTEFEGLASWYGEAFQGRPTASGEPFDKEGFTAAHPSLPFGTLLRVSSLDTGASVVVRVNDRGPFVGGRVVDLSEAAARLIGLVASGTGPVRCRVLPPEEAASFGSPGARLAGASGSAPPPARSCRIQVASFREAANAADTLERLRLSGIAATIEVAGAYRRIVIAEVPEPQVEPLLARLRELGYRSPLLTWRSD